MNPDELRARLDAMMAAAACESCDALLEVVVRHYDGGTPIASANLAIESGGTQ